MGWDIYFFHKGAPVTREDILKNDKYKEDEEQMAGYAAYLYVTYIDDKGNERRSGLWVKYGTTGNLFYGTSNYSGNAIPLCRALYQDFGIVSTEEEILYFDSNIEPYVDKLSDEEYDLVSDFNIIFYSYALGTIDEPRGWVAETLLRLREYQRIIYKYDMDVSRVNMLGPSYETMKAHDEEQDATYWKRKWIKHKGEWKYRISRMKDKIRKFLGIEEDLPF